MLKMLSGSSNSTERPVISILDSKPQELMNFIDRVFHPISSSLNLPKELKVLKLDNGNKENPHPLFSIVDYSMAKPPEGPLLRYLKNYHPIEEPEEEEGKSSLTEVG
jgi:hypothetical protein